MSEFMWRYVFVSLLLGFIDAVIQAFYYERAKVSVSLEEEKTEFLEKMLSPDSFQKEVYGDRTVFFPKDERGRACIEAVDSVHEFEKRHRFVFLVFLVFSSTLHTALIWPYLMMFVWGKK